MTDFDVSESRWSDASIWQPTSLFRKTIMVFSATGIETSRGSPPSTQKSDMRPLSRSLPPDRVASRRQYTMATPRMRLTDTPSAWNEPCGDDGEHVLIEIQLTHTREEVPRITSYSWPAWTRYFWALTITLTCRPASLRPIHFSKFGAAREKIAASNL